MNWWEIVLVVLFVTPIVVTAIFAFMLLIVGFWVEVLDAIF